MLLKTSATGTLMETNGLFGYRADPKGKFGGKDKMETLPTEFDRERVGQFLSALRDGQKYGVPKVEVKELANIALQEGKHLFGYNDFNQNNKKARDIFYKLLDEGYDDVTAGFAAAVYDKKETAERLNIPFGMAWNGTGKVKGMKGRTGATYAQELEQKSYGLDSPKNKDFLSFIDSVYNKPAPQPEVQPVEEPSWWENPLRKLRSLF